MVHCQQNNPCKNHVNKKKHKNHLIHSTVAQKAFDKRYYSVLIKKKCCVGIGEHILYHKIHLKIDTRRKIEIFSLKLRKMTRMSTVTTVLQHSTRKLSLSNKKKTEENASKSANKKSNFTQHMQNLLEFLKNIIFIYS